MVAVHVRDEYAHSPIDAGSRREKLALSSFAAIEEENFRASPDEYAWKIPELVGDASTRPEKCYGN
jgi:hypothetical protein